MHSVHSLADASPVCALNVPVFFCCVLFRFCLGLKLVLNRSSQLSAVFEFHAATLKTKTEGEGCWKCCMLFQVEVEEEWGGQMKRDTYRLKSQRSYVRSVD